MAKATVSWKLFEAMKYQLDRYPEVADNLFDLFKTVKADDEHATFWKRECLTDYEDYLKDKKRIELWLVEIVENNITGETTFVDICRDRATAKAVSRHLRKGGVKKFISVMPEPRRWV